MLLHYCPLFQIQLPHPRHILMLRITQLQLQSHPGDVLDYVDDKKQLLETMSCNNDYRI